MGHGALGIGHGASGIGHGASGRKLDVPHALRELLYWQVFQNPKSKIQNPKWDKVPLFQFFQRSALSCA
jgi:hypothetical protein